jgi:hypothetical protein
MAEAKRKRNTADYAIAALVLVTLVATIVLFGRTGF